MTVNSLNLLRLVFVSLLFVFVSCDKDDTNRDTDQGNKYHSYEIKMVIEIRGGSQTSTYKGGKTSTDLIGRYQKNVGDKGALVLDFQHDGDLLVNTLLLTAHEAPMEVDVEEGILTFNDSRSNYSYTAVSGTIKVSELKIAQPLNTESAVSYVLEFEDVDFEYTEVNEAGESVLVRCTGEGTIKIGQPIP